MWLTEEKEFTDGLVTPVGCQLQELDVLRCGDQFTGSDIKAAQATVSRLSVDESGKRSPLKKAIIVALHGYLRVFELRCISNSEPDHEREPYFKIGRSHDDISRLSANERRDLDCEGVDRIPLHSGQLPGREHEPPAIPFPIEAVLTPSCIEPACQLDASRRESRLDVSDSSNSRELNHASESPTEGVPAQSSGKDALRAGADRLERNGISDGSTSHGTIDASAACGEGPVPLDGQVQMPGALVQGTVGAGTRFIGGIVAVVDFMNLLVRAFHAGQPSKIHAVRSMLETIGNLIDRVCPEFLIFALDGGHDYRSKLHPGYKANRPPKDPLLVEQIALAEQVIDALGWPAIRVKGWEADDVIASVATQFNDSVAGVVLVSSDKDVLQVCATTNARVYHPWGEGLHLSLARCLEKYGVPFHQMRDLLSLCGCSTDCVPGVPGVGEKTACTLLANHGSLDKILEASSEGLITGKGSKGLKEHPDAARLSRELVTLRTDLPIGEHWTLWPLTEPRAGWKQRLVDLGLGSIANRLAQRLGEGRDRGNESSIYETEFIVLDLEEACSLAAFLISPEMQPNHAAARAVYDEAVSARQKHGKPAASGYHEGTLLRIAWDAGSNGTPFESIDLLPFDQFGKPLKPESKSIQSAKSVQSADPPIPAKSHSLF